MNRQIITLLFFLSISVTPNWAWGYDGSVHSKLNEEAVEFSQNLESLLNGFGYPLGIDAVISNYGERKTAQEWIAYGGEAEDYGWLGKKDYPRTRAFNHFHDPLKAWDEAGLDDYYSLMYTANYFREPVSPLLWGLNPGQQDFTMNFTGDWSWGKARELYYFFLTGRDFAGDIVAITQAAREAYFAGCLRAVGQVMHLLEDASVPLHTRNDVHVFPFIKDLGLLKVTVGRWTYETYTKENIDNLDFVPDETGNRPDPILLTDPQPDSAFSHLAPVTGLFDRNQYNWGDPIPAADAPIGLAEYSNANFLTNDSMWTYPHPAIADTNYDPAVWLDPETVDAEDGQQDQRIYFRKNTGDPIERFMVAEYWYHTLHVWGLPEVEYALGVDRECFADYAEKIIPRAVGYSAALLDYFFRGRMDVEYAFLKKDSHGTITGIELSLKNTTPSDDGQGIEPFDLGVIDMAYQYTPADGDEPVFGLVQDVYQIQSPNDLINSEYVSIDVDFPEDTAIPLGPQELSFTLVFNGQLGMEQGAVAGMVLPFKYRIAYYQQPGGVPNQSNIFTILPDGMDLHPVTDASGPNPWYFDPAWSPDGRWFAFEKEECAVPFENGCPLDDYSRQIVVIDRASEDPYPENICAEISSVIDTAALDVVGAPAFAPNGNRLVALVTDHLGQHWGLAIYDIDTGIGQLINDTDFWEMKDIGGVVPAWSPQGDKIAYGLGRSFDTDTQQWEYEGDIYLINPDGSGETPLTNDQFTNIHPAWSPDGTQIAFVSDLESPDGTLDIWTMNRDGSNKNRLLDCSSDCYTPSFTPDGKSLTFNQGTHIYRLELETGQHNVIAETGYLTSDIEVSPLIYLPTEVTLTATPQWITPGETVELSWHTNRTDSATTASLDNGIGSVDPNGTLTVNPTVTTTYTIYVEAPGGSANSSVTVTVTGP